MVSPTPCSFIRYKGGLISQEPAHAAIQRRRVTVQSMVLKLESLFANRRKRFKLNIAIYNERWPESSYLGHRKIARVTVRGRWRVERETGRRYIGYIEIIGPLLGSRRPRARYRLEPDGGMMPLCNWAIDDDIANQVNQTLGSLLKNISG